MQQAAERFQYEPEGEELESMLDGHEGLRAMEKIAREMEIGKRMGEMIAESPESAREVIERMKKMTPTKLESVMADKQLDPVTRKTSIRGFSTVSESDDEVAKPEFFGHEHMRMGILLATARKVMQVLQGATFEDYKKFRNSFHDEMSRRLAEEVKNKDQVKKMLQFSDFRQELEAHIIGLADAEVAKRPHIAAGTEELA